MWFQINPEAVRARLNLSAAPSNDQPDCVVEDKSDSEEEEVVDVPYTYQVSDAYLSGQCLMYSTCTSIVQVRWW